MILDHTIGSARAERRKDFTGRVVRHVLTALLGSALALPSLAAWGMDTPPNAAAGRSGDVLPLPPIPHLESTPWMKWNAVAPTQRIDTLMAPRVTPSGVLQDPRNQAPAKQTFG